MLPKFENKAKLIELLNTFTRRSCCHFIARETGELYRVQCPFDAVANSTFSDLTEGKIYKIEDVVVLKEDLETYFSVNGRFYHLSFFSLCDFWLNQNKNTRQAQTIGS